MEGITLKSTRQELVLTIDKTIVGQDFILRFLDLIEIEYLIEKLGFDNSVEETGELIVQSWWDKNKGWLLNPNR